MCKYFSCIATKEGKVLFYEGDEHEEIINRSGLNDDILENREFVRIEVPDGDMKNYNIDEDGTLPRWFEKRENEFYKKVQKLLSKVQKVKNAIDKEYQTKRDAIDKEYQTKWDAVFKEYWTKWDAIFKEYQTKRDALYGKIKGYLPKEQAVK
jgi:tRNA A58 N-methylase Trm61